MSARSEGRLGAVSSVRNGGAAMMIVVLLLAWVGSTSCRTVWGQARGWDCLLQHSTPEANPNNLQAIIFAQDRFVAVGDSGTILVSTNGNTWLRQATPTQCQLKSVTAGEGQYVVVGDAGCVLRSTNSHDWAMAPPPFTNSLRAIAFGNGAYVVLDDQYRLHTSVDALDWQLSTNGLPATSFFSGIYFGGGLFVAYGLNGLILTSTDGLNWSNSSVGTATFFSCGAYGGGSFVVAGHEDFLNHQAARSSDGRAWTPVRFDAPNGIWSGLCYGNGQFVGVDDGQVVCSMDGSSWGSCGGPVSYKIVAYGLGQYLALGNGGTIFASTNLSTWNLQTSPVCSIHSLAQGNGVYAGVSDCGNIFSSEDGIHFIQRRACDGFLTSVIFTNGLFVTAGNSAVLHSTDATNWTTISPPCSDVISQLKYADGLWMAICGNRIISSAEGTNWFPVYPPCPNSISTIQFSDGLWVASCGNIMSSIDGTNWTVQLQNEGALSFLIHGDNRWVGCGVSGRIWSSPDGINWQNCSYPTTASLGPIAYQDGLYSIYSTMTFMVPTTALVSPDGLHWVDASLTGPIITIHEEPLTSTFMLSLGGMWGSTYSLQRSYDLNYWSDIRVITNSAGVTTAAITNLSINGSTFFRAVAK